MRACRRARSSGMLLQSEPEPSMESVRNGVPRARAISRFDEEPSAEPVDAAAESIRFA